MFYSASENIWLDGSYKDRYEKAGSWPADAVEYPIETYEAQVINRPAGKVQASDSQGRPILVDAAQSSPADLIRHQIVKLEAQQTPRRMREAALGVDSGLLASLDAEIAALRQQLAGFENG